MRRFCRCAVTCFGQSAVRVDTEWTEQEDTRSQSSKALVLSAAPSALRVAGVGLDAAEGREGPCGVRDEAQRFGEGGGAGAWGGHTVWTVLCCHRSWKGTEGSVSTSIFVPRCGGRVRQRSSPRGRHAFHRGALSSAF